MEKGRWVMSAVVGSLAATSLLLPVAAFAQTTGGGSAPVLLDAVEEQQQAILGNVNLELLGAAIEVRDIPSMPRQTASDQEALADEFSALAARLDNLESVETTIAEAQAQENSIAAVLRGT